MVITVGQELNCADACIMLACLRACSYYNQLQHTFALSSADPNISQWQNLPSNPMCNRATGQHSPRHGSLKLMTH